ncbi:hypothetical protein QQF64_015127, partial [Cirrhinus molitorella]
GKAGGRAGGSCIPPLETELRIQHPDCCFKPIGYKRCRTGVEPPFTVWVKGIGRRMLAPGAQGQDGVVLAESCGC